MTGRQPLRIPRILPGLTPRNAARETLAGVTLLAIAVPLNIGYAQIAGLPPTAGLYALIVPAIVYALIVSSRQLVASPDAAAAALVASSLGGLAVAGSQDYLVLAFAQAIIAGVIFVLCAVFKLGFLASFLSKPILVGFVGGLALDILVSQIAKMLGVKIDSGGEFVDKVAGVVTGIPTANLWSIVIAAGSVVVLVVGRRIARVVPWALVVLIVSTVVVVATGLEAFGVSVLGTVEAGPPTLTWPVIDWVTWLQLVPSAIALALVTMAEGLLVARSYGEKRGYPTSPNRDLLAFGAGNIAAGATGGFTVGSSTSRTAAMDQAGSRTQLPSLVAAVGTLALVLFGTALLEHIPSPAIGAIVAIAILPLLGVRDFIALWRQDRFEFAVGAVCFLGALLLGPIAGIVLAFVLALINLAKRAANPAVDILSDDDTPGDSVLPDAGRAPTSASGVVVVRFAAPLFFANATVFEEAIRKAAGSRPPASEPEVGPPATPADAPAPAPVRDLVLDLEAVTDIDVTGAESFHSTRDWLTTHGVALHYSRLRPDLRAKLAHYDLLDGVDVYATNRDAVAALTSR
ncbi:SulP family inorganic anion transporter [Herbiconiux daphne]|uniref:SulP family inorganic anion transporter n=1 Tax=Herbiconiux daphne TaxID=2970914 RepID=A0ABT2H8Q0_9MICO|nr:SulP family inorganic anion transporter [Herbiconiux daphne]MCS5736336.1 SulP family inorganic anion transporter [Herbiconiux daphne]